MISMVGMENAKSFSERQYIVLLNRLVLIYIFMRLAGLPIGYINGEMGAVYLFLAAITTIYYILMRYTTQLFASYYLLGTMLLSFYLAFPFAKSIGALVLVHLFISIMQLVILLFAFNYKRQQWHFIFVMMIIFANMFVYDKIMLMIDPTAYWKMFAISVYKLTVIFKSTKILAFLTMSTIVLTTFIYRNIIDGAEKRLNEKNKELSIRNKEIESLNNQLNKRVDFKEKQLEGIAFKNSHDVRAPLARAKMLIDLLRSDAITENNEEQQQLVNWLSDSVEEIDDVLHEISDDLDV
jgi:signal transduction histidine kinase